MPKDLRSFLQEVEDRHPEEILRIHDKIHSKWEVTALQVKLENQGKFPLIIAEKALNVVFALIQDFAILFFFFLGHGAQRLELGGYNAFFA